jgi:hypothetical protein
MITKIRKNEVSRLSGRSGVLDGELNRILSWIRTLIRGHDALLVASSACIPLAGQPQ